MIGSNELIVVRQLPVIEEQLRSAKEYVEQRTSEALSAVCTVDTVQACKSLRAELRKEFAELEERRKIVKTAILAPYEHFESAYRECVSDLYRRADADLKQKIDDVETEIKKRCEDGLREYFDELCAAHHVEWLTFEQSGVKVDMVSAKQKTPKKLREQLVQFASRVAADLNTIANMENAEEIAVEYKKSLNLADAIFTVSDRHRRIEAEEVAQAARKEVVSAEMEAVKKVEALAPPVVKEEPETLTVTFTVTDTRERLVALREWMKGNGYEYR